jgi:hypothetical protein
MILAQGASTFPVSGEWAAFFAFLALIVKDVGKWFAVWLKDKKEERRDRAEREQLAHVEALRQHTLDSLLSVNREQVKIMLEIKSHSDKTHSLDRMRFETLNSKADKSVCKADCPVDRGKYNIIPQ